MHSGKFCRIIKLIQKAFGNLQFLFAEKSIRSQPGAGRPIAYAIRGMRLYQLHGRGRGVVFGFADFFSGLCQDEAADHDILPGNASRMVKTSYNCVKGPGTDDFMSLMPHAHRQDFPAAVIALPESCID